MLISLSKRVQAKWNNVAVTPKPNDNSKELMKSVLRELKTNPPKLSPPKSRHRNFEETHKVIEASRCPSGGKKTLGIISSRSPR